MSEMTKVTYRIRRYDPNRDTAPHYETYTIDYTPGLTVLEGLWRIKETLAPDLVWRASCRMGVCGSCGMLVNGMARLACNTQISELGTDQLVLAPLPNFNIIRDLVPDLLPMIHTHQDLHPYLVRDDVAEQEGPTGEYYQSIHDLEQYLQFSYCIKCACCMAACPTVATDPTYAGPMPLGQVQRYNTDTRDSGFAVRKEVIAGERGPWRCHYAGECSRVCPKGVDPAKAIQLLKRQMVLDVFGLRAKKCPSKLVEKPKDAKRRDGIPEAPKPTV